MKLGLKNWVIGSVKQNNNDLLNVEKQHYIFVSNGRLLYIHKLLTDSMDSDQFTEWLGKKYFTLVLYFVTLLLIYLKYSYAAYKNKFL